MDPAAVDFWEGVYLAIFIAFGLSAVGAVGWMWLQWWRLKDELKAGRH